MKVWPKNDEMRKLIKHPSGVAFRDQGPANWPNDSFTARRVRDGDVTLEETSGETRVDNSGMRVTGDAHVLKAEAPRPKRAAVADAEKKPE